MDILTIGTMEKPQKQTTLVSGVKDGVAFDFGAPVEKPKNVGKARIVNARIMKAEPVKPPPNDKTKGSIKGESESTSGLSDEVNKLKEEISRLKETISQKDNENKLYKKIISCFMRKKKEDPNKKVFFDSDKVEEMEKIETIGHSAKSQVIKVSHTKTGKFYALKIFQSEKAKELKNFIRDFEMTIDIYHPCLTKTEGFTYGSSTIPPTIILKFYPTTLHKQITLLNDTEKVTIIAEILIGMRFIQDNLKMIHRNMKPENIMLSKNKHTKIGDFGLATLENIEVSLTKGIGTMSYMSPELLSGDDYTNKVDQYAVGKIIYFILTNGNLPEFKMKDATIGKEFPIPDSIPEFGRNMIRKCCSVDPEERPNFSDLLNILKNNKYALLPDINQDQIEERIAIIEIKDSFI